MEMKILVLMATYNGERYIEEQIDSVLSQIGVNIDIVISDDNSGDETVAKIENLILKGYPITLIKNTIGSGCAANNFMNLIKQVDFTKDYFAYALADQDDIWLPEKLVAAANLIKSSNCELYMSNLTKWDEKLGTKENIKKSYPQKKYDFLFEGGSAGCTYVLSRSFFEELQYMICELNYTNWPGFSHDWLIYFFARIKSRKVYIDEKSYILYRMHDSNVHGHLNQITLNSFSKRIDMIKAGWYKFHIKGFLQLLEIDSESYKIYYYYNKGIFGRLYILAKYNFSLIRSANKFLKFFILNLLPVK